MAPHLTTAILWVILCSITMQQLPKRKPFTLGNGMSYYCRAKTYINMNSNNKLAQLLSFTSVVSSSPSLIVNNRQVLHCSHPSCTRCSSTIQDSIITRGLTVQHYSLLQLTTCTSITINTLNFLLLLTSISACFHNVIIPAPHMQLNVNPWKRSREVMSFVDYIVIYFTS